MTPKRRKSTEDGMTMYETILMTLDGTPSDRAIIEHIKQLGKTRARAASCCFM